ncbi:MAG: hypothetical protein K9H16_12785 [Bacteroidales bacterium]|nr:hypothetical protein [Bacteroidales bacterium]
MMNLPKYPSLYQINTRVWITELSETLGRKAILDDVPDAELDRFASMGFDWIWFLSVWTTGDTGRSISMQNPEWRNEFEETLPDLQEQDIGGSGFAVAAYKVHPGLGGDYALKRLRTRLKKRGIKLMLDFVPNHMGPDHPWIQEHPDYFVSGTAHNLQNEPQNYTSHKSKKGDMIFAYGRDPYFAGWLDTVQLDYSNPETVEAMSGELHRISGQCDGVRCDMAMLVLPEVFERTWGRKAQPFWPIAIKSIHESVPGFCFMAEVYWDMEWTLQQMGFDYTYDKRLYDRLVEGHARSAREHLYAGLDYQNNLARFLENHDEPRAASTFGLKKHEAAAVITYFSPGLRFFHQGQFEGRKKRISPHLVRAPQEIADANLQNFYSKLIFLVKNPVFRDGHWKLLECVPSWHENHSWDSFLVFAWEGTDGNRMLIAINFAPNASQCFVRLPYQDIEGKSVQFDDLMSHEIYIRDGNDLMLRGLFLDMPAWGYHIFEIFTT